MKQKMEQPNQQLSARRTLSLSKQPTATTGGPGQASSTKTKRVPSIRLQFGDQTIELTDIAANGLPSVAAASSPLSDSTPVQPPPGLLFSGASDETTASTSRDSSRILGKKSYLAPVPELTAVASGAPPGTARSTVPSLRAQSSKSTLATTASGASAIKKKPRWVCISEILVWITLLSIVGVGGVLVYNFIEKEEDRMTMLWSIAGTFACLTCAVSLHDVHMHIRFYYNSLQRLYIRILFMCVVYAFTSWMALRFLHYRVYFEIPREWYESLLLYGFHQLMLQFLGGKKKLANRLKETGRGYAKHLPGCCCLRPWRLGSRFVHRTTLGVHQYVIIRFVISAIALVCQACGVYQEGSWSPKFFYLYAVVIINISQGWALYCLGLFYVQTKQWLGILRPLVKFGLIKLIVFVFFWQTVAIAVAGSIGLLKPMWGLDLHDTAAVLQNTIIEAELLMAAIAHHFFFSYRDFYSEDPTVVTPIMKLQQEEAEFDARQAAEAAQKANHDKAPAAGAGAPSLRTRTESDLSAFASDPSFAALADPSVSNDVLTKALHQQTPRIKSARTSGVTPGGMDSVGSHYKATRTASLSVPMTATAFGAGGAANAASNFNLADAASASTAGPAQTPRRGSAGAPPVSARSDASPPDAGPVVVVGSPGDLELFPDSSISIPTAADASSSSVAGSKRSSLGGNPTAPASSMTPNPFDFAAGEGDGEGEDGADAGLPTNAPAPLPVSQALYEMLPIDVMQETAAQFKSGFGLIHKLEKRKAEQARAMEVIRNSERAKKSKFATSGSVSAGLRGSTADDSTAGTAENSLPASAGGSVESSRRASAVIPGTGSTTPGEHATVSFETASSSAPAPAVVAAAAVAIPPSATDEASPAAPEPFLDWAATKARVELRSKTKKERKERSADPDNGDGHDTREDRHDRRGAAASASNPFDEFA